MKLIILLWGKSRGDWAFLTWYGNQFKGRKSLIQTCYTLLKTDFILHPTRSKVLINMFSKKH